MPLRVGFDLDGTVADMYSALHREAVKLFGEDVLRKAVITDQLPRRTDGKPGAPAKAAATAVATLANKAADKSARPEDDTASNREMQELHLTARQQMQLWDHVKRIDNFWTTLKELEPGIIARIAKAAADRRWEVIF